MRDEAVERARRARARARRAEGYPGRVVPALAPKPALWSHLSPEQRWDAMAALCHAQWIASGREIVRLPRAEWPGEIFRIGDDD